MSLQNTTAAPLPDDYVNRSVKVIEKWKVTQFFREHFQITTWTTWHPFSSTFFPTCRFTHHLTTSTTCSVNYEELLSIKRKKVHKQQYEVFSFVLLVCEVWDKDIYIKIRASNLRNFSTSCEQQVHRLSATPNKDPLHLRLCGLPTVVNTDGVKVHSIGLLCILLRIAWIPYPTLLPLWPAPSHGVYTEHYIYLSIGASNPTSWQQLPQKHKGQRLNPQSSSYIQSWFCTVFDIIPYPPESEKQLS